MYNISTDHLESLILQGCTMLEISRIVDVSYSTVSRLFKRHQLLRVYRRIQRRKSTVVYVTDKQIYTGAKLNTIRRELLLRGISISKEGIRAYLMRINRFNEWKHNREKGVAV